MFSKINKKTLIYISLLAIFLIGFSLRFYKLSSIPYGFHGDEGDAGYIGKYILLNGKDIYGNSYPLHFNRFGDYRPGGIFYLVGLSESIFGMNEFAVRLPSAVIGSLTVLLIYFLVKEIFNNTQGQLAGISAAAFLAISPWHVNLSRATSESIITSFLIILAVIFLMRFIQNKKKSNIFFSLVFFCLSYFFYHTARILVPIILFYFVIHIYRRYKEIRIKKFIIGVFIFFVMLSAILISTKWGGGRVNQIIFLHLPGQTELLAGLASGDGENNILVARIFHNKIVLYSRYIIEQYLQYFSGQYLFIKGGLPERYVVPEAGLLYVFQLPLVLIGCYYLVRNKEGHLLSSFLIYLLLIAPIPAALTWNETPNIQRSSFLIIPLTIICAYGFHELFKKISTFRIKWALYLMIGVLFLSETVYAFHQYYVHHSQYKTFYRDDGTKELMQYIVKHSSNYDRIIMHRNVNAMFYLFYSQNFDENLSVPFNEDPLLIRIGKVYFVAYDAISSECVAKWAVLYRFVKRGEKALLIDSGICSIRDYSVYAKNVNKKLEIWRKDSTQAYSLYEYEGL